MQCLKWLPVVGTVLQSLCQWQQPAVKHESLQHSSTIALAKCPTDVLCSNVCLVIQLSCGYYLRMLHSPLHNAYVANYHNVSGKCPWVLGTHAPKIEGGQLNRGSALNSTTIPVQVLNLNAKLAAREYWICLHLLLHQCFVEARSVVEKAVLCLKADWLHGSLVAKLLQHSLLTVHYFCTASEECYKQVHGCVCAKLWCQMSWKLSASDLIASMYVSSADILSIHYPRIQHGGWLHRGPW